MHKSTIVLAVGLISSARAHLFIQSPTPIAGSAIKQPLDGGGSDFPCHGVSIPTSGGTPMAVGSQQNLTFDGGASHENTATHGGGSCQISITYKTAPADVKDPANWKVLYSIVGGCPTNSPANMDGQYTSVSGSSYTGSWQCSDPNTNGYDCLNTFGFTIPPEVKNGQATLAWTWFNTVGNREMYMNCISVDITGGKSDDSGLSTLPNMFVANVAATNVPGTCKTTEMTNLIFPNPGKYVTSRLASSRIPVATAKNYPSLVPTGCGAVATGGSGGSGSSNTAAPAPAPAPASSSAPAPAPAPAPATTSTKAAPVQTSATTLSSQKVSATTTKAQIVSQSSIVKRPPGTSAAPAPATTASSVKAAPTGTSSCAAGSVPCSNLGDIVCPDLYHFGICDYGNCALSQAVAPGTACIGGQITWAPATKQKKIKRHLAKHIHEHKH